MSKKRLKTEFKNKDSKSSVGGFRQPLDITKTSTHPSSSMAPTQSRSEAQSLPATSTPTLKTDLSIPNSNFSTRTASEEKTIAGHTATRSTAVVVSDRSYSPAIQIVRPVKVKPLVEEKDEPAAWWLGPSLLVATVGLLVVAYLHFSHQSSRRAGPATPAARPADDSASDRTELKNKVDYYKLQVGRRLNRERIQVSIENQWSAPELNRQTPVSPPGARSMMSGVPLLPEGYGAKSLRDSRRQNEPLSMDHPDARIQYSLQEEQIRDQNQTSVDRQYIQDFLDNARREGYEVKLDENLNVISVQKALGRKPADSSLPSTAR